MTDLMSGGRALRVVRAGAAAFFAAVAVFCVSQTARADHPAVAEAQRLYDEAEFERARSALEQAEAASDLTREDLVRVYELRALVALGMRDEDAMRADLRRLAAVDPAHQFAEWAPPEIAESFAEVKAQMGAPLRLTANAEPTATGVRVQAEVHDDEADIIRATRVSGRVGGGEWRSGDGRLDVTAPSGSTVEYYAEAVGPGGAVVTSVGSIEQPLSVTLEAPAPPPGGFPTWVYVGAGAVIVVGLIAVVAITASGGSNEPADTRPSLPMQVSF